MYVHSYDARIDLLTVCTVLIIHTMSRSEGATKRETTKRWPYVGLTTQIPTPKQHLNMVGPESDTRSKRDWTRISFWLHQMYQCVLGISAKWGSGR